ncbi:hypothetical protein JCM8547_004862 [Rhodosporidiobolus lusitaniae]
MPLFRPSPASLAFRQVESARTRRPAAPNELVLLSPFATHHLRSSPSHPSSSAPASTLGPAHISSNASNGDGAGGRTRKTVKVDVLLDGDADYFTGSYMTKGARGGLHAALDLRNKLRSFVLRRERELHGGAEDLEEPCIQLIVKSFMNATGLASFFGERVNLPAFMRGFNASGEPFSMIDVGNKTQAADEAIKGHIPFLVSTCDLLLVGGSHDGGYASALRELGASVLKEKVRLVRTTPYYAEPILQLGLEEVRFDMLFEGRDPSTFGSRPFQHNAEPARGTANAPATAVITAVAHGSFAGSEVTNLPSASPSTSPIDFDSLVRVLREQRGHGHPSAKQSIIARKLGTHAFHEHFELTYSRIPSKFVPLTEAIRLSGEDAPRWETIRQFLHHAYQILYEPSKFKKFLRRARKAGIVSTGVASTENGGCWVQLASDPSSPIPLQFFPLLEAILRAETAKPLCSNISGQLSKLQPTPYSKWKEYVQEAKALKLVSLGVGETLESEWVAITHGLVLPPSLVNLKSA